MPNRRAFITQVAASGLLGASSIEVIAQAVTNGPRILVNPSKGSRIKSVIRREETTLRLGGHGDNFYMSWAADDRQFVAVCDGIGFSENPRGEYNSRLFTVSGDPREAVFQDVPAYPDLMRQMNSPERGRYFGFGTLAVDGRIYQFLSVRNHAPVHPDGSPWPDLRHVGAKLIYSPDNGRTWCNQDGSTPVVWEPWGQHSRQNMIFFNEPQDAFSLHSILQMGRDYELNRDGYVYVYAPNGNTEGTMNELVMFRVPKAQVLNRSAYEYFAGFQSGGGATWNKDINARKPVCTFPRGWVNKLFHPMAWMPSIAYNAPLNLYIMANWGMGVAPDGNWFGKPSYLGFWIAPNAWGPWTQIHEETAWLADNDPKARAYSPVIAPGWIAQDGKSFWLVWTDWQQKDAQAIKQLGHAMKAAGVRTLTHDEEMRWVSLMRRAMPYYSFNAQRVDLVVA